MDIDFITRCSKRRKFLLLFIFLLVGGIYYTDDPEKVGLGIGFFVALAIIVFIKIIMYIVAKSEYEEHISKKTKIANNANKLK